MRKYKVKCPFCEKFFYREDEEYEIYKNRFYHKECYDKIKKENDDKEKLEKFIKELFQLEILPLLIKNQIKKYVGADYNYTFSGIMGSLDYFFNIKKNDIHKSKGIGIVPYIYDEAKQYFTNLNNIENKNKDIDLKNKTIKIIIKKPKRQPIKKIYELEINNEGCDDE